MRISDWSSDVCSSDLRPAGEGEDEQNRQCRRRDGDAHQPEPVGERPHGYPVPTVLLPARPQRRPSCAATAAILTSSEPLFPICTICTDLVRPIRIGPMTDRTSSV